MKICIASWAPFHAGAEVAAERLACGLAEDGHDVSVVLGTDGESLERMRVAGLDCSFVPMCFTDKWRFWKHRSAQRKLAAQWVQNPPDLVHCNDLPTGQMVGLAARRANIPLVCHHRWLFDGSAIDWLNKFGAERHLFVSQALQEYLCHESKSLADSPGAVVYDGLPLPAVPTDADRVQARRDLDMDPHRPLVLFAGQITERKGVADVLRAWEMLPQWHAKAELRIVGDDLENDGAYRRDMKTLAETLAVPVQFMGFRRDVPVWLTAADVVLVPSHAEPLGNATLEAMAHARPVIGTRVGGIPEMIVDEKTGLLVESKHPTSLAAAIARLLDNLAEAQSFGAAARQRCEERFSITAHVESVLNQYNQALEASRQAVCS